MRLSTVILLVSMAIGTTILTGLGIWQLQRLAWKENLIATIEARTKLPPVSVEEIRRIFAQTGDIEYLPVEAAGIFDHTKEAYFYTTHKGAVGWDVLTPIYLDGVILIVNRGFVPDRLRDPVTRPEGQTEGIVEITGLARIAQFEKPNRFVPDNDLAKRQLYWKSAVDMALIMAGEQKLPLLPFLVDAGPYQANVRPYEWPKGGTTLISFPNNHLQYALTWFGLALALLGVGSYFLYSRRDQNETS